MYFDIFQARQYFYQYVVCLTVDGFSQCCFQLTIMIPVGAIYCLLFTVYYYFALFTNNVTSLRYVTKKRHN